MNAQAVEILIVEDNPDDEELTLLTLEENGITNPLVVVRDGVEALEYIDSHLDNGPRLIMLDLKLPRVDGIQVLERLKSDPRTRSIPVVVLTSSREEPDILRCYQLGVNSYIVKPVDFNQFRDAVRQVGMYWLVLNQPPEPGHGDIGSLGDG
jgi:CheY-like chemotaxis protein